VQLPSPPSRLPRPPTSVKDVPLGVPAELAQPALQTSTYKELVNKLAWALGSSYGKPYNNMRTAARVWANSLAGQTIAKHGYPGSSSYPK